MIPLALTVLPPSCHMYIVHLSSVSRSQSRTTLTETKPPPCARQLYALSFIKPSLCMLNLLPIQYSIFNTHHCHRRSTEVTFTMQKTRLRRGGQASHLRFHSRVSLILSPRLLPAFFNEAGPTRAAHPLICLIRTHSRDSAALQWCFMESRL
ncbi:hypothetical protein BGY98DRAFT_319886 [Russula aff. rugulosa BPL654]|nr:hypothetical protein BGY98DRAFT_319886 [Russula aff. rugulosa BPL654]